MLSGYSGADRWVMTAALLLVGGCQIATGAGLTAVHVPARVLLILTGLSTLGIAANPEPGHWPDVEPPRLRGELRRHDSASARTCRQASASRPWILSARGCATVTVIFAGLSCWLLVAARDGAGDLGMVERLTSAVQGLFPLVVALALRQAAVRGQPGTTRPRAFPALANSAIEVSPGSRGGPATWKGGAASASSSTRSGGSARG